MQTIPPDLGHQHEVPEPPTKRREYISLAPIPPTTQRCTRCLYHEDTPNISFDSEGICSYCRTHEKLDIEYPQGQRGEQQLQALVETIKNAGRGKRYDCVVGVSGGCDSSYLLLRMKEMGLRPLAAHFDNTWNSAIATENIHRVISKLNVDLFTIVVDNKEYDDIYRSFLYAGVPDIDSPTDIGLAATLYRAAEKHNIKYIIEGHSFRTEGIAPLGYIYMDGKYVRSVHKIFGTGRASTYPNMPLHQFLKWMVVKGIKKVRPLYLMDYEKESTKKLLAEKFNWQWYGGHHLENRFTAFFHSYFWPKRFGFDDRIIECSALIRSGQLTREEGLRIISSPREYDPEIITLIKKRLSLSDSEFDRLMSMPRKTYRDYPTYKKTFERLRFFFYMMYKLDLVPKSFYMKYTHPDPLPRWFMKEQREGDPMIMKQTD